MRINYRVNQIRIYVKMPTEETTTETVQKAQSRKANVAKPETKPAAEKKPAVKTNKSRATVKPGGASELPAGLVFDDDENLTISNPDGSEFANLLAGSEGIPMGTGHPMEENLRKIYRELKSLNGKH